MIGRSASRFALVAAVAGCEIVGGIEPFTPALDGGAAADGGTAADAEPPDASPAEGGLPDVTSPDGAAARWCSGKNPAPFLCDDFDDGPALALAGRWTSTQVNARGEIKKGDSTRSAPFAFAAHTTGSAGGGVEAFLLRDTPADTHKFVFGFDVLVPASCKPVTTNAFFVLMSIVPVVGGHHLNLLVRPEGAFVEEYVVGPPEEFRQKQLSNPFPYGAWTRVEMQVDFGANDVNLFFDGKAQIPPTAIDPRRSGGRVHLGLSGNGNLPSCDALYDNVVLELQSGDP